VQSAVSTSNLSKWQHSLWNHIDRKRKVVQQNRLEPMTRVTLFCLSKFMNNDSLQCSVGYDHLGFKVGAVRNTVKKHCRLGEAAGFLVIEDRGPHRPHRFQGVPAEYLPIEILTFDEVVKLSPPEGGQAVTTGGQSETGGGQTTSPGGQAVTPNLDKNLDKNFNTELLRLPSASAPRTANDEEQTVCEICDGTTWTDNGDGLVVRCACFEDLRASGQSR
jgi:hypothetical protein